MNTEPATFLRVGHWVVEEQLNRLRRDDTVVHVEPKVMDLLVALAGNPGQPLSKAELRQRLWPDTVVADGAVKHVVWELRRALGDDAREPRFVETVARRGYRLIASVDAAPAPDSGVPAATDTPADRPARGVRRAAYIAGAVVAAAGAVAFAWWTGDRSPDRERAAAAAVPLAVAPAPPVALLPVRPLTSDRGNEIDPALSPDGRSLAYAWDRGDGGPFDIYLVGARGGEPVKLTDTAASETSPVWSPDGRRIAFARTAGDGDDRAGVYLVGTDGTEERKLAGKEIGAVRDVAWLSVDAVVVSARAPGQLRHRLHRVPIDGGQAVVLTDPAADGEGDRDPAVSPDGRVIAFRRSGPSGFDAIMTLAAAGGGATRLATAEGWILGLAWAGDRLVFSSNQVFPGGLWTIPAAGGKPRWLPVHAGFVADPTAAPGTGEVAFQTLRCDSNVWRFRTGATGGGDRVLATTRQEHAPQLSPDGDAIAFVSGRSGTPEVWLADRDGNSWRQLTRIGGPAIGSLRWNPDASRIAFDVRAGGGAEIHVIDVASGETRRVGVTGKVELAPSWTADGSAVYASSDRAGDRDIWRYPIDGGAATRVTRGGASRALVGPSGQLYATRAGRSGLWRVTADGGFELVAADLPAKHVLNWDVSDDAIYYLGFGRRGGELRRYRPDDPAPTTIAPLPRALAYPPGLSVSRDGSTVLYTRLDEANSDILAIDLDDSRGR